MKRQWTAFFLALCLLTGGQAGLAVPRVQLVCRVSSLPMTPILQEAAPAPKASKTASCCHVHVSPPASPSENGPTFALTPGSCCVLHVSASTGPLPLFNAPPSFDVPLASPPACVSVVPRPFFAEGMTAAAWFTRRVVPPRAPPAGSTLGRAPPQHDFS